MRNILPAVDIPLSVLLATPALFLLFIGIVWWTYRRDGKRVYKEVEQLPLQSDEESSLC